MVTTTLGSVVYAITTGWEMAVESAHSENKSDPTHETHVIDV